MPPPAQSFSTVAPSLSIDADGSQSFSTVARRLSMRLISDDERRDRAALRLQSKFRQRKERRRYIRLRRSIVRFQATSRGYMLRKGKVLEVRKEIKVTREVRKAAYKSMISGGRLDWRLESLQTKHKRITYLALGGLLLMIVVNELVYADWKSLQTGNDEAYHEVIIVLRALLFASTAFLCMLLIDYHRLFFTSSKQLFGYQHDKFDYFVMVLARDVILCAVHPFVRFPSLNIGQIPDDWKFKTSQDPAGLSNLLGIQYVGIEDLFVIVSVAMFLRVPLMLFRRLWLHSKSLKLKARFLARSYHIDLSLQLAIRVTMRDDGVAFLLGVSILSVFCFSYVYYVLERQYAFLDALNNSDGYDTFVSPEFFLNSLWSNVIVLIGIGFDYPPQTYFGRIVLVMTAVAGLALFALMTAAFADALSLKDAELRLMHVVQRSEGILRIQTAAVRVIQRAWKSNHYTKASRIVKQLPRWAQKVIQSEPLSPVPRPSQNLLVGLGLQAPGTAARGFGRGYVASPVHSSFKSDGTGLDTPTRRRRREVVRQMRESVLDAADAQIRKVAENRHQKALKRALTDWKVERHRNATTTEMIENVTTVLKELRDSVDAQSKELASIHARVDALARQALPPGKLQELTAVIRSKGKGKGIIPLPGLKMRLGSKNPQVAKSTETHNPSPGFKRAMTVNFLESGRGSRKVALLPASELSGAPNGKGVVGKRPMLRISTSFHSQKQVVLIIVVRK